MIIEGSLAVLRPPITAAPGRLHAYDRSGVHAGARLTTQLPLGAIFRYENVAAGTACLPTIQAVPGMFTPVAQDRHLCGAQCFQLAHDGIATAKPATPPEPRLTEYRRTRKG